MAESEFFDSYKYENAGKMVVPHFAFNRTNIERNRITGGIS
jgi:hypothetical protein